MNILFSEDCYKKVIEDCNKVFVRNLVIECKGDIDKIAKRLGHTLRSTARGEIENYLPYCHDNFLKVYALFNTRG